MITEAIYATALFYRAFEEAIGKAFDQGHTPGLVHLSHGAEIVHALLAHFIQPGLDQITASHRCHSLALAGGASPEAVALEILGRAGGLNDGFAGSQHLNAPKTSFLTATGIVGAQVPIALGAALSQDYLGQDGLGIAVLGDGALAQGAVLEAMNLASVEKLPFLMIVENNGLAQNTQTAHTQAGDLCTRARAFGFEAVKGDVDQPEELAYQLDRLMRACRHKEGPCFLEISLPRLTGHYHSAAFQQERPDPLINLRHMMTAKGLLPAFLDVIEARARQKANDCIEAAIKAPEPSEKSLQKAIDSYQPWLRGRVKTKEKPAEKPEAKTKTIKTIELSYHEALNYGLKTAMAEDPRIFIIGEDIAEKGDKGGVFGVSKGLLDQFGPKRVRNMPISESAFMGMALGAALTGLKPIVEIMFADFLSVCMDPLINQAAKARFLSGLKRPTPLVIRTSVGAGDGSGAVHSQSFHGLLAAIPGLRLLMPTSPEMALRALRTALDSPDPVVLFEPKALYDQRGLVDLDCLPLSLGEILCHQNGKDLTIVAFGPTQALAQQLVMALQADGIEASFFEPIYLSPIDSKTIREDIIKTGRLLILDEDSEGSSMADALLSHISQTCFSALKKAPIALHSASTPIPAAKSLEKAWMLNFDRALKAAKTLCDL